MAAGMSSLDGHLLAARGFIVFAPDTGAGIARSADGPQAELSNVVDRGLDALIAAGYADDSRLGLIGFSQGGFASLWLATHTSRYRAVVSINGWSDLAYEFFDMTLSQEYQATDWPSIGDSTRYLAATGSSFHMGGYPWDLPAAYVRNSPLWRSNGVTAPILLIHSDMDVFGDAHYKMFFDSLYMQRKEAKLLIYRGEGHSPSSPANIRNMWENIDEWFDRHLQIGRAADGQMILSN